MKSKVSRHLIYTLVFGFTLTIFTIWFAADELVSKGKEYRKERILLKRERVKLRQYQDYHDKTLELYNQTKTKYRYIIDALQNKFEPQTFLKRYQPFFIDLSLSKLETKEKKEWYDIYEVNTTSKIKSPKNFYNFLDALNKSEWLIGITFPINFERKGDLIHSSFTMHVYKKMDRNISTNGGENTAR